MNKPVTYSVKTTVTKTTGTYSTYYHVTVEGSGFTGKADGICLGQTFEKAFEDLMSRVAEGIFPETDR